MTVGGGGRGLELVYESASVCTDLSPLPFLFVVLFS